LLKTGIADVNYRRRTTLTAGIADHIDFSEIDKLAQPATQNRKKSHYVIGGAVLNSPSSRLKRDELVHKISQIVPIISV
jgi:hypothetical protein